jgi:N-acetylneuraminic acid mutarotase
LYIVGGQDASGKSTAHMYSLGANDTSWKTEQPMANPRNHLAVVTVNDRIYAIAGRNEETFTLNVVEMYDPTRDAWAPIADMPTGRSGLAAAVVDGKIYVLGGETSDKVFYENEVFDPATRSWARGIAMPEGRHGLGVVSFNNGLYVLLGGPQPGLSVSDTAQILEFAEK